MHRTTLSMQRWTILAWIYLVFMKVRKINVS